MDLRRPRTAYRASCQSRSSDVKVHISRVTSFTRETFPKSFAALSRAVSAASPASIRCRVSIARWARISSSRSRSVCVSRNSRLSVHFKLCQFISPPQFAGFITLVIALTSNSHLDSAADSCFLPAAVSR